MSDFLAGGLKPALHWYAGTMKVVVRAVAAAVMVGCSSPSPQPPPEQPATSEARPQAPASSGSIDVTGSVEAAPREIYIDSVTAANPLVVKGRARTFENNVILRVRDSNGALISETFTTSSGEIGHHNPYEAQLWVTRDPGPRVTVEAFEHSAKDGSVRSLVTKEVAFAVPLISAQLTFPGGDCTQMLTVTRRLPKSAGMARLLVEALLDGPSAQDKAAGATTPFPSGSEVKSVILRDGVLTVDFNERLQNVGGSCAVQAIRASVTETLKQLPTVKRIVITAGGSEKLALQP